MGRKVSSRTQPILSDNHTQVTCQRDTVEGDMGRERSCVTDDVICACHIRFENMDDSRRTLL